MQQAVQVEDEFPPSSAPPDDAPAIVIRYRAADVREVHLHPPSGEVTAYLTHLLRNRRLWRDVPETLLTMAARCEVLLQHLGLGSEQIGVLGRSAVLEIEIARGLPTPAREFPWEFALAEATRPVRRVSGTLNRAFLVVRHTPDPTTPGVARAIHEPRRGLLVESAPGRVAQEYDFESERRVVASSLELESFRHLRNPTLDVLAQELDALAPDIVHLTGVDAVQGAEILAPAGVSPLDVPQPGMYFRVGREAVVVPFGKLADKLMENGRRPALVAFNIFNSVLGAAEAIRAGARYAIGFQNEVDDIVAEQFFASFYAEWKRAHWDVVEGFRRAWLRLGSYAAQLRGTGIILWSSDRVLAPDAERAPDVAVPSPRVERVVSPADVGNPREHIGIGFTKADRLNYSLLHNGDNLFTKFTINRLKPGIYTGVTVEIKLYAGLETAQYEASFQLSDDQPTIDVNQRAKVPLTSQLTRSLAESVFTTISFCVRWGPHVIEQQTERVELLPIDEWQDDDLNRKWLPSFVLPRDPAVRRIVDAAQRYLVALADDSGAGFDGYQSYDAAGATLDERCRYIDAQVKAVWWALVVDFPLGYINPPPTFTDSAQRLRTPTDVLAGKRGTCIDLALLLAACLEYVEIHPVIFLLSDHAFPGYCRSERGYQQLSEIFVSGATETQAAAAQGAWFLPASSHGALMRLAQRGEIVPLETVELTRRGSFATAVDEGLQNLRSRKSFHALYDIRRARQAKPAVTPLPLWSS